MKRATALAVPAFIVAEAAAAETVSGNDAIGCASREHYDALVRLAGSNMTEFSRTLAHLLARGACVGLRDGEFVIRLEGSWGLARIECTNGQSVWTNAESLK